MRIDKDTNIKELLANTKCRYDKALYLARHKLLGLTNIHGTVIAIDDPEIQSSSSYDSELTFDSGYHGVRWDARGGKGKQSYYQSDDHNLR